MKDPRFAKLVVMVNCLVPGALLAWDAWNQQLGPNPPTNALHTTGLMALILLLASLAITPARKIGHWNALSHFRRMLGLMAFFYALAHFTIYLLLFRDWPLSRAWAIVRAQPMLAFGLGALLLLIPLAATSTNGIIRRMGGKNWKRLHTLVYPAAIAAAVHFYLGPQNKNDRTLPWIFIGVLAGLLGYRVGHRLMSTRRVAR